VTTAIRAPQLRPAIAGADRRRPMMVTIGERSRLRSVHSDNAIRLTAWVHGQVQGVGFRWWTRSRALELGLVGSASNLRDGRVEIIAEGSREACETLLATLRSGDTPGRVDRVTERWTDPTGNLTAFVER
jgi:acylphosphatase